MARAGLRPRPGALSILMIGQRSGMIGIVRGAPEIDVS
jgi:hypothetical protein